MRPPRLSTRRLMLIVAVMAVILAVASTLIRRRARFQVARDFHFSRSIYTTPKEENEIRFYDAAGNLLYRFDTPAPTPEQRRLRQARHDWHVRLSVKYGEAARRPWLPVEPDPPEPPREISVQY
ncbi:hypothetical protein P12x_002203 [Tundrisphaera lichenicola]|uniref:hypothetical protein n=1 Tax=Tundrisphaera lichenicola TaxID=2029860 RepID=UPI003EBE7342